VPIIIYCKLPFKELKDVSGVRISAHEPAMKYLKKFKKLKPVFLPLSELKTAFNVGLISCSAFGGNSPKFSLNGPLPAGWKNKGLPKSKLR
jgi:hypothetical protein